MPRRQKTPATDDFFQAHARDHAPDRPAATADSALADRGVNFIEAVLSPSGAPVLGLYVTTAYVMLLRSLAVHSEFKVILPHLIGTPAVVSLRPGISQVELAKYVGGTRAGAGKQVEACIARGWIKREGSPHDKRRYSLYVTPKGKRMLSDAAAIVPRHEAQYAARLTLEERETLKRLLGKLIGP